MRQKYTWAPIVLESPAIGPENEDYRWVLHPEGIANIGIQVSEKGFWLEYELGFWVGYQEDTIDIGDGIKISGFLEARDEALKICKFINAQ